MKQIIKNFNNLVKKTIFKLQNKTNNNFNISVFNKYLITFIVSLFIYLFYLLVPLLYDKTWVQSNIEKKLLKNFKINISTSADISYRILPAPHFLIKDSKILISSVNKKKSIAEIKDFKVFLSQRNLFNKEKMRLNKIVIDKANLSLLSSDLKLLGELKDKKFSNRKININNSNIFLKDKLSDTISIIKINKAILFFDDKKLSNFFNLNGEIFNIPFTFTFENDTKYEKINFNSRLLKLNISNESIKEKNLTSGKNNISLLKSIINTKYNVKEKLVIFKSNNSRLDNSKLGYTGKLSINPFDLDLIIDLNNYKISKLFNPNPILIELIKSRLLFNDNISVNSSIIVESNIRNEIFHNGKINFHIINGQINFNKTKFSNNDIGSIQLDNSNLFYKNNDLIFNSNLLIDITNIENLFSLLNTNRSSRKIFKSIFVNFNYNFLTNKVKINNLKIDNKDVNSQFLSIIDGFNINNFDNLNKSRRLFNELLKAYVG